MTQSFPLVEQLKNLEQLQELDLKIDAIKKDQILLPSSLKDIDESLEKLLKVVQSKKEQIMEIEKNHRQAKAALDLNKDRMARSQLRLESIQNSQEYQAVSKEIDQLKKLSLSLEEEDKKALSDLEIFEKQVQEHLLEVEKLEVERKEKAGVVSGKEDQLKIDVFALMSERLQYTEKVEARILLQYERVRGARGGFGIVSAVGGRCKGCNMIVPPQLYNEIHRGTVLHCCPSCHRILFVPSS